MAIFTGTRMDFIVQENQSLDDVMRITNCSQSSEDANYYITETEEYMRIMKHWLDNIESFDDTEAKNTTHK